VRAAFRQTPRPSNGHADTDTSSYVHCNADVHNDECGHANSYANRDGDGNSHSDRIANRKPNQNRDADAEFSLQVRRCHAQWKSDAGGCSRDPPPHGSFAGPTPIQCQV